VPGIHLTVSNLRNLVRPDRRAAAKLKSLVHLGRELLATELALKASSDALRLDFRLAREGHELLDQLGELALRGMGRRHRW
jgi:hypothetical protein